MALIGTQCLNCNHLALGPEGLFACPKCGSFDLHHFRALDAGEQPDILDSAGLQRLLAETLEADATPPGEIVQFRKGN